MTASLALTPHGYPNRAAATKLVFDIVTGPTRANLADGRELLFFALPGNRPAPVEDRRPLPARATEPAAQSQLRFDRSTGQWVIIAALRQDRTYKPPPEACPLCPGPTGLTSEVPAADYDVVVFENRFPSLSGALPATAPVPVRAPVPAGQGFVTAPGLGRCEVICFSADHTGSVAGLKPAHARLVVEAWRHRTADLMARPGIEQVFCFENRGEEIGVTLTHPHGQIYGYPYLTPRAATMLEQARQHRKRHSSNLFGDLLSREIDDGGRIIARNELFTAFVPFAARWPVEVHIYPNRFVRNLTELGEDELGAFTHVYLDVLGRFDRMYSSPLPYISALHQYADTEAQAEGYFHVELMSIRRSATKLKYLAASESAMDAFIGDVMPESVAQRLRELA
ncbi:galactose-1-phosphate uridylyltransferase [Mycobacterium mantenii]|uniref:Galactose-1-phosphate uridylyltransferase n=1 Tax=Mycobacterium mantenii TaxID=560555 RepID=A0A1X0G3F8_MYCNT|nr:galactose-1-phosphate uridylyltransferase [Mycobacterium mantenii]MCV7244254.1 galactose-1-phosphate uridylyltransferase [Mycobacterium mantenii]ORB08348.1 galactose-1-phosphate uridylyltransferase [Mycobacterium mantenii]BBY39132.1 galactose-1-phosphate uridylyltransferase [Mycobacterium mantenii]